MQYNKNLLSAVIVIMAPGEKPEFKKYRNIKNATPQLQSLITFAKGFSFAHHINLYHKKDRSFYKQIKLIDEPDNFQPHRQKKDDGSRMF